MDHRVALYERAEEPILEMPKPYDDRQGWTRNDDGVFELVSFCGPILPNSLVDLLDIGDREEEEDDEEEDEHECDFNDYVLTIIIFKPMR